MRRAALFAAGLAALGCSGLLGLDDFKDAPASGGAAGTGATGGTTPTGGAAGSGAAPSGGGTGAAGGSGGAAGSGGTSPTGGAAGTGGSGATGGAAGSGGSGGQLNYVCTPALGSTFPSLILDKSLIPGNVSPRLVLAADDVVASPSVFLFLAHDFGGTPPSGRFDHELVAVRVDDIAKVIGPALVPIDMMSPFTPALAHVTSSGSPEVTVLGNRQGAERWTYTLDSSHALQLPPIGSLMTFISQSKCAGAGPNAYVESSAFTYAQNDERVAATCVGAGSGNRELWVASGGNSTMVVSKPLSDPSLTPMGYWDRPSGNTRILWQNDGGFRSGNTVTDLAQPPVFLNSAGAVSQSVLAMVPRKGGVTVFLHRSNSAGNESFASAELMEPYGSSISSAVIKDLGGPVPFPGPLQTGNTGAAVKALAGATGPDQLGQRHVRLVLFEETTGNVRYNADVFGDAKDIQSASAVQVGPDKYLVVWLMSKSHVMGAAISCVYK